MSRCSTVSAWSSAVWPVAIHCGADLGRDLREELVAHAPGGRFQVPAGRERRDVGRLHAACDAERCAEFAHEGLVGVRFRAAQPVVDVRDGQRSGRQRVQHRSSATLSAPPGHGDHARPAARVRHEPPHFPQHPSHRNSPGSRRMLLLIVADRRNRRKSACVAISRRLCVQPEQPRHARRTNSAGGPAGAAASDRAGGAEPHAAGSSGCRCWTSPVAAGRRVRGSRSGSTRTTRTARRGRWPRTRNSACRRATSW